MRLETDLVSSSSAKSMALAKKIDTHGGGHASQPPMTVRKSGWHSSADSARRRNHSRCVSGVACRSGT